MNTKIINNIELKKIKLEKVDRKETKYQNIFKEFELNNYELEKVNIKREFLLVKNGEEYELIDGKYRLAALLELLNLNKLNKEDIFKEFIFILYSIPEEKIGLFKYQIKNFHNGIDTYEKAKILKEFISDISKEQGKYTAIEKAKDIFQIKDRWIKELLELADIPEVLKDNSPKVALKLKKFFERKKIDCKSEKFIEEYKNNVENYLKMVHLIEAEEKFKYSLSDNELKINFNIGKKNFSKLEKEMIKEKILELNLYLLNLKIDCQEEEIENEIFYFKNIAEDNIKNKGYFLKSDLFNQVTEEDIENMGIGFYKEDKSFKINNFEEKLEVWRLKNYDKTYSLHDKKIIEYIRYYLSRTLYSIEDVVFTNKIMINYDIYSYSILKNLSLSRYNFFQILNVKNSTYDFIRNNRKGIIKKSVVPDAMLQNGSEFNFFEYEYSMKKYKDNLNFLEYFENKFYNYILLYTYELYKRIYDEYSEKNISEVNINLLNRINFSIQIIYNSNFYSNINCEQIKNKYEEMRNYIIENKRELLPVLKHIKFEIIHF